MRIYKWTSEEISELREFLQERRRKLNSDELEYLFSRFPRHTHKSVANMIYKLRATTPELKIIAAMDNTRIREILREEITNNPDNLRRAFRNTEARTGVKEATLTAYWYNPKYSNSVLNRDRIGTLFMTVGKRGFINRKNSVVAGRTRTLSRIWTSIKKLFKK